MNYKISDKYREKNLSEWGKPKYQVIYFVCKKILDYESPWPTLFTALHLADRKSSWGFWDYQRSNHDVQSI